MIAPKIVNLIKQDEGCRLKVYKCTAGKLTIGYGHLIGKDESYTSITQEKAEELFLADLQNAVKDALKLFPTMYLLSEARQGVLISMSFQLGLNRLSKFKRFIAAVAKADWQAATHEMFDSLWFDQTPNRVTRLASILQRGEW
jgi:lysozyme